jgi:hypothetical protein
MGEWHVPHRLLGSFFISYIRFFVSICQFLSCSLDLKPRIYFSLVWNVLSGIYEHFGFSLFVASLYKY